MRLVAAAEVDLVASGLRLKLTVDYHCCSGALLFPWSYSDAKLSDADTKAHVAVAHMMQTDIDPDYRFGATGAVLGYRARGTSKDYYYATYHALAFTFEGDYGTERSKFHRHTTWWDHVLAQLVH